MPLNDYREAAHLLATAKGWWLHVRTFGDMVALFHSEVSEAFEEHRAGHKVREVYVDDKTYMEPADDDWAELAILAKNGVKPKGIGIEIADILIRIFDFAGEHNLDLDALVNIKSIYNRTRPYRHGDKVV